MQHFKNMLNLNKVPGGDSVVNEFLNTVVARLELNY